MYCLYVFWLARTIWLQRTLLAINNCLYTLIIISIWYDLIFCQKCPLERDCRNVRESTSVSCYIVRTELLFRRAAAYKQDQLWFTLMSNGYKGITAIFKRIYSNCHPFKRRHWRRSINRGRWRYFKDRETMMMMEREKIRSE